MSSSLIGGSSSENTSNGQFYSGMEPGSNQPLRTAVDEAEGASLFRSFLSNDFHRRHFPDLTQALDRSPRFRTASIEPRFTRLNNQLEILSEEFARSPLRSRVEEQAARVPLAQLNFQSLSELLYALFQEGGVNWERVVVLFFFSSCLAARALQENLHSQVNNIIDWSLTVITGETMSRWVQDNGGWVNVLEVTAVHIYRYARIGFFMFGIFAFASYIWRSRS